MTKSEFEKRAIRYLNDPHQWLVKLEDIVEATKDFPNPDDTKYKDYDVGENPIFDWALWIKDVLAWRKRWFG